MSKGDQKEDEHDRLEEQEPVAPASVEMGCCGCADEPSSKVEPTVNAFPTRLLKQRIHVFMNILHAR